MAILLDFARVENAGLSIFASEINTSSTITRSLGHKNDHFSALPPARGNRYRRRVTHFESSLASVQPSNHKLPVSSLGSQTLSVVPLARTARTVVAWSDFGTADRLGVRRSGKLSARCSIHLSRMAFQRAGSNGRVGRRRGLAVLRRSQHSRDATAAQSPTRQRST